MVSYSGPPQADATTQSMGGYNIDRNVLNGVRQASKATGVDFAYLMAQAAQESGFQANASAPSSSAKGLYQFIDSTWLQMMRDHGAQYGQAALASQIQTGASGVAYVSDPALRQRILNLRNDPTLSAALGAEYARGNKEQIEASLGRPATATDLYMAHFLGGTGATQFLAAIQQNGNSQAADLLPKAAAANPSVFYDADGKARTVSEIYGDFQNRIESKAASFAQLGGTAPTSNVGQINPALIDPAMLGPDPKRTASIASFASSEEDAPIMPNSPYAKPSLSLFSVVALSALELIATQKTATPQQAPPPQHDKTKASN
jgi:hypothetical protein